MARSELRLPRVSALLPLVASASVACSMGSTPDAPASVAERRARLGPCDVSVSRVNVDQVGVDDGSRELLELFVPGGVGQPLSACGVWRVGSYEGSGSAAVCSPEPPSRFAHVADVIVPADGFVLITRGGSTALSVPADATTTQTKGPWLENGPDYLVIEGENGPILGLQVGSTPSCTLPALPPDEAPETTAVPVTVLPKEGDTSTEERILVGCDDGFRSVPLADSPPHTDRASACATTPTPTPTPTASSPPSEPPPPAPSVTTTAIPTSTAPPKPPAPPASTTPPSTTPPPPCRVRFSKVDVAQPATVTNPTRDSREAVELFVEGSIPADATLATCGVTTFAPYRAGSKSEVSLCGSTAGAYGEVAIGHLPVPFPPYVLLAQRPDADSPLSVSKSSALLSNGPDYLTLRDETGAVVDAVMYPAPAAPAFYPSCPGFEAAAPLPACEDAAKKGTANTLALRCEDGSWMAFPDTEVAYRAPAPPPCGPAGVAPTDDVEAGAGGAAGAGAESAGGGATGGAGAAGEGSHETNATGGAAGRAERPPLPASEPGAGGSEATPGAARLPLREHACSASGRRHDRGGRLPLGWAGVLLVALRRARRWRGRLLGRGERDQQLGQGGGRLGFRRQRQDT
jgi:hypothetical protein